MYRNLYGALKCNFSTPAAKRLTVAADAWITTTQEKLSPQQRHQNEHAKKKTHASSRKIKIEPVFVFRVCFRVLVSISRSKCAFMQIDPLCSPAAASWIFYRRQGSDAHSLGPFAYADSPPVEIFHEWREVPSKMKCLNSSSQLTCLLLFLYAKQSFCENCIHSRGNAVNYLKGCCDRREICVRISKILRGENGTQ